MASPKEIADQARRISEELILFARMLETDTPKPIRVPVNEKPTPEPEEVIHKQTYQNDPRLPGYDPEPPFKGEVPPPREQAIPEDRVIIKRGQMFVCNHCNQPVLMANKDVMAGKFSLGSFDCLDTTLEWPRKMEIYKMGGVSMNCPSCSAYQGIWFMGKPIVVKKEKYNPNKEDAGSF